MAEPAAPHATPAAAGDNPFLQLVLNPDGTFSRPSLPTSPPSSSSDFPVLSTDIPLNPAKSTYIRLYSPTTPASSSATSKLPLVVYFHGGGFVLFGPDSTPFHFFCERLAAGVPAVVASVSYRLAPESPLPAAYEDAAEALEYLRAAAAAPPLEPADRDLLGRVDFSKCFLMGSSAGANIAYHATLGLVRRRGDGELAGGPLRVAGLALHQPFFGGEARTASELAGEDDAILPLRAADMMWRLALPAGANRDHAFCNPMNKAATSAWDGAPGDLTGLPRCLVTGSVGDPLLDRQKEFVKMLESAGVEVKARLDGTAGHGAETFDAEVANKLISDLRGFIEESGQLVSSITASEAVGAGGSGPV